MAVVLPNPDHTGLTEITQHGDDRTLGEQLGIVVTDVKTLGRMAKDDAQRKLGVARERGGRIYDRARKRGRAAIERRPLTSLGVAAGLGALACLLWTRGPRR